MVRELTNCPQCSVSPGQRHDGCSIARCRSTGVQWIACDGEEHTYRGRHYGSHEGPCEPSIWEGFYPGCDVAEELDLWVYFGPEVDGSSGWVKCSKDHPNATEDLNGLWSRTVWDAEKEKLVAVPR